MFAGSVHRGEMLVREYDMGKEAARAARESPGLAWLGDAVVEKERVRALCLPPTRSKFKV